MTQRFLKLDMVDEDATTVTTIEAESLDTLLDIEAEKYRSDDRLNPCYGFRTAECISRDNDSILWQPGDGSQYTIAVCVPDTEEGHKILELYLHDDD